MKKLIFTSLVVILISLMIVSPAFAKMKVVKGEVTAVDPSAGTITVLSNRGETVVVIAPTGFDLNSLKVGDSIMAKGDLQADGKFAAEWIKSVGKENEGEDDEDKPEGSKENSAFCDPAKKDQPHPLAVKLADKYGVTEEWVMGYLCDGYSVGAIMLALKTGELTGTDPAALLADRAGGKGWGQIWQELKLIGSEKEFHSPPGLLKKPERTKP